MTQSLAILAQMRAVVGDLGAIEAYPPHQGISSLKNLESGSVRSHLRPRVQYQRKMG